MTRTLIVQGKKLGFTPSEISNMVEARSGHGNENALKLTAETCLEQVAFSNGRCAKPARRSPNLGGFTCRFACRPRSAAKPGAGRTGTWTH